MTTNQPITKLIRTLKKYFVRVCLMKYFFSRRDVERRNNLEQNVVDALRINSFRNKLKKFEKPGWIFTDPR